MNQLIRPSTREDALFVAECLQEDDKQEIYGLGHSDLKMAVALSILNSEQPITFMGPDGIVCGVAGITRTEHIMGQIWMLTTNHVKKYPKLFLKESRKWVDSQTTYDLLFNIADPRNRMHMKLLHILGFKRLGYQSVGPDRLTYVEFAKLQSCALLQPQSLQS